MEFVLFLVWAAVKVHAPAAAGVGAVVGMYLMSRDCSPVVCVACGVLAAMVYLAAVVLMMLGQTSWV